MKELTKIKYWIFDLDNTLYSGQTKVFSEVDKKMSSFISKKFNVDLVEAKKWLEKAMDSTYKKYSKVAKELYTMNELDKI